MTNIFKTVKEGIKNDLNDHSPVIIVLFGVVLTGILIIGFMIYVIVKG